jgi:phosphomannomutase
MFRDEARAWAADDPDPATRSQVERWLADDDEEGLREAFHRRLTFGTSGIRGPLGAGAARMNRRMARQIAAGLASTLSPGASVVIGRDGRRLSPELAAEVAGVLAGAGLEALLLPGPVPTPVVAFAVRELGCAAGVVVTASHNPPDDNGLKLYGADGGQLVAPADAAVADAVTRVANVTALPLGEATTLGLGAVEAYLDAAAARVPSGERAVRVVHTALHGVTTEPLLALFERAGIERPHIVEAQAQPDAAFPTISSPNPEELDALALALAEGARVHADIVFATDPDGDRLAVAVPVTEGWRVLTGDEIGILLAEQALLHSTAADRVVASSFASSRLLGELAASHGATWIATPPGFKWIARAADQRPGATFVFGYEESLGFAVHDLVRDKDALSAAAAFAVLVADLRVAGETVPGRLDDLARRFGVHVTRRWSLALPGARGFTQREALMRRLREAPPAAIAGRRVALADPSSAEAVELVLDGDVRVVVRPSGTEPKLKAYVEAVVSPSADTTAARTAATNVADEVRTALVSLLGERL